MTMSVVIFTLSSVKLSRVELSCLLASKISTSYRSWNSDIEDRSITTRAHMRGKARESFIVCRWRRQKQRVMRNDNAAMRAVGVHPSISIHNAPRCRTPWSILGDAQSVYEFSTRTFSGHQGHLAASQQTQSDRATTCHIELLSTAASLSNMTNYRSGGIQPVQACTRWHFAFALCCHSNATRALIANPLKSSQGPSPTTAQVTSGSVQ